MLLGKCFFIKGISLSKIYSGNPILGDQKYGIESLILKGKGLYLHASQLDFTHPFTKEKLALTSALPKKFNLITKQISNLKNP